MKEVRYAALLEGSYKTIGGTEVKVNGYYAEKQPKYEWSFTDNFTDAKLYKTLEGAEERIIQAKFLGDNITGKIVEIHLNRTYDYVGPLDYEISTMPKDEWKTHQENCTKERCLVGRADCPVVLGKVPSLRKHK